MSRGPIANAIDSSRQRPHQGESLAGYAEWNSPAWNSAEVMDSPADASSPEPSSLWMQMMVGILLMRSALDLYSGRGVPAAFAIAVDLFVLVFIGRQLILRRPIHTDRFWWLLMGWVALQGIWVVLLPVGGVGGTPFMTYEALREWVRFFSLGMVYLLTMQLRDRIPPERLLSILMLSLVIPLFLAALQISRVDLPGFLQSDVGWKDFTGTGDRINGTLGHYNSFATFLLLFIALTLWRMQLSRRPWIWAILLGSLLYCLTATKSLTGLVMLLVFGGLYFLPRLKGKGILGLLALGVTLWILFSTELGQQRLVELNKTPLLNPDLSFHQATVLQAADMKEFRNSFNWRLLQWRDLLSNWQRHPWLGYGLSSTKELSVFNTTSHNDYLRFLLEGGIVGLGLFLSLLATQVLRILQIMRRSAPHSPQRSLSQVLFPFSIALMVGMAAGNVMVHTAMLFYWWTALAILGWQWPHHPNSHCPNNHRSNHWLHRQQPGIRIGRSLSSQQRYLLSPSQQTIASLPSSLSTTTTAPDRGRTKAISDSSDWPNPPENEDTERAKADDLTDNYADDTYNSALYDADIYSSDRYELDNDLGMYDSEVSELRDT